MNSQSIQIVANTQWKEVEMNGKKLNIPVDWNQALVSDHFDVSMGPTILGSQVASERMEVEQPVAVYSATEKATVFGFISRSFIPGGKIMKEGDVVVGARGSIGFPKIMKEEATSTQTTIQMKAKGGCSSGFFVKFCNSEAGVGLFHQDGSGVPMLTVRHLDNCHFVFPDVAEQEDVDHFLTTQEGQVFSLREQAALERKRLQWLSDELLSGRLRVEKDPGAPEVVVSTDEQGNPVEVLPAVKIVANTQWKSVEINGESVEIPEGWEMASLSEIAVLQKGQNLTRKEASSGNIKVVAGGKSPAGLHNVANRPSNCITVSASGANAGYVGFYSEPIFATDCTTVVANEVDQRFLYRALLGKQQEITDLQVGGAQPHVYASDLKLLTIVVPPSVEQSLIATILSTQEEQVIALHKQASHEEKRLEWLSEELLSGRLRVKIAEGQEVEGQGADA